MPVGKRRIVYRRLAGLALGALPIGLIAWLRDSSGVVSLPTIIAAKETHFPDAMDRLAAVSESLGTISLGMIAAGAYLVSRQKAAGRVYASALAYLTFLFSLISIYFAVRLGYFSALSLAVGSRDIIMLVSFLDYQAFCALIAAGLLVSLAIGGDLKDEK